MSSDGSKNPDAVAFDGRALVLPELEEDETVPPRPEEEIADVGRAEPDLDDRRAPGQEPAV